MMHYALYIYNMKKVFKYRLERDGNEVNEALWFMFNGIFILLSDLQLYDLNKDEEVCKKSFEKMQLLYKNLLL